MLANLRGFVLNSTFDSGGARQPALPAEEVLMLHMLVAKHGPDTCPASRPDYREKYMPLMGRIPEAAQKFGVKLEGSWTNMPAHTTYMLVEAPDAQAVCDFAAEVQLMNWNWIDSLLPVITMEEASSRAQTRPL